MIFDPLKRREEISISDTISIASFLVFAGQLQNLFFDAYVVANLQT